MEQSEAKKDPIVEEIRKVRVAHAEKFGYDLQAIVRDLKKHERGNRKVVLFPPKRLEQVIGLG